MKCYSFFNTRPYVSDSEIHTRMYAVHGMLRATHHARSSVNFITRIKYQKTFHRSSLGTAVGVTVIVILLVTMKFLTTRYEILHVCSEYLQ